MHLPGAFLNGSSSILGKLAPAGTRTMAFPRMETKNRMLRARQPCTLQAGGFCHEAQRQAESAVSGWQLICTILDADGCQAILIPNPAAQCPTCIWDLPYWRLHRGYGEALAPPESWYLATGPEKSTQVRKGEDIAATADCRCSS